MTDLELLERRRTRIKSMIREARLRGWQYVLEDLLDELADIENEIAEY